LGCLFEVTEGKSFAFVFHLKERGGSQREDISYPQKEKYIGKIGQKKSPEGLLGGSRLIEREI
jgi:hypothetical protein